MQRCCGARVHLSLWRACVRACTADLLLKRVAQKSRPTLDLVAQIRISSRTVAHGRQERVAPVGDRQKRTSGGRDDTTGAPHGASAEAP